MKIVELNAKSNEIIHVKKQVLLMALSAMTYQLCSIGEKLGDRKNHGNIENCKKYFFKKSK